MRIMLNAFPFDFQECNNPAVCTSLNDRSLSLSVCRSFPSLRRALLHAVCMRRPRSRSSLRLIPCTCFCRSNLSAAAAALVFRFVHNIASNTYVIFTSIFLFALSVSCAEHRCRSTKRKRRTAKYTRSVHMKLNIMYTAMHRHM